MGQKHETSKLINSAKSSVILSLSIKANGFKQSVLIEARIITIQNGSANHKSHHIKGVMKNRETEEVFGGITPGWYQESLSPSRGNIFLNKWQVNST